MPYQLGHMCLEQGLAYYNVLRDGETKDSLPAPNDLKEEERQIAHKSFLPACLGIFTLTAQRQPQTFKSLLLKLGNM